VLHTALCSARPVTWCCIALARTTANPPTMAGLPTRALHAPLPAARPPSHHPNRPSPPITAEGHGPERPGFPGRDPLATAVRHLPDALAAGGNIREKGTKTLKIKHCCSVVVRCRSGGSHDAFAGWEASYSMYKERCVPSGGGRAGSDPPGDVFEVLTTCPPPCPCSGRRACFGPWVARCRCELTMGKGGGGAGDGW
jgi:hypothetical protein